MPSRIFWAISSRPTATHVPTDGAPACYGGLTGTLVRRDDQGRFADKTGKRHDGTALVAHAVTRRPEPTYAVRRPTASHQHGRGDEADTHALGGSGEFTAAAGAGTDLVRFPSRTHFATMSRDSIRSGSSARPLLKAETAEDQCVPRLELLTLRRQRDSVAHTGRGNGSLISTVTQPTMAVSICRCHHNCSRSHRRLSGALRTSEPYFSRKRSDCARSRLLDAR